MAGDGFRDAGILVVPSAASIPPIRDLPGVRRNLDAIAVMNDLLMGWDCLAVLLAAVLSALAYSLVLHINTPLGVYWTPFYQTVAAACIISPLLLRDRKMTSLSRAHQVDHMLGNLVRSGFFLVLVMLGLGFATHSLNGVSRLWVVLWTCLTLVFSGIGRVLFATYLQRLNLTGMLGDRVVIVGAGSVADRLVEHFRTSSRSIYVVGVFHHGSDDIPPHHVAPRGDIADVVELAQRRLVDWIVLTLPAKAEQEIAEVLLQLKTVSARIALCPELVSLSLPHRQIDDLDLPMMLLSERPLRRWQVIVKEVEDKVLGGLLLVLGAPLLGLVALAIRLESPGPVIFSQKRHGWNNTEFTIFKFRTMRWEPEVPGVLRQATRRDVRVTRIGAFLRRTSLDELPQLLNVLRGDMSLVGPRPHALAMRTEERLCHEIIAEYAHRHRVKPGITGWAQVSGFRGATQRAEQLRKRVEYDLFYAENWSLMFDLKILALTCLRFLVDENAF